MNKINLLKKQLSIYQYPNAKNTPEKARTNKILGKFLIALILKIEAVT